MLDESTDKDLKLNLLLHHIDTIRGTVYNQALFAEFEQRIHSYVEEGAPLTADYLDGIMLEIYERYYGSAFNMNELYTGNWSRIPHFYRSFYVFQYVTGFSAAAAIARNVLDGVDGAVEQYLKFLKSGSSDYSINLLQKAGIDMNSPEPVKAATRLLNDLLDEVEKLL
jgi:oligoendopeptidase F